MFKNTFPWLTMWTFIYICLIILHLKSCFNLVYFYYIKLFLYKHVSLIKTRSICCTHTFNTSTSYQKKRRISRCYQHEHTMLIDRHSGHTAEYNIMYVYNICYTLFCLITSKCTKAILSLADVKCRFLTFACTEYGSSRVHSL